MDDLLELIRWEEDGGAAPPARQCRCPHEAARAVLLPAVEAVVAQEDAWQPGVLGLVYARLRPALLRARAILEGRV